MDRAAARAADLVWLCDPNNPTGLPERDGAIATLLADLAAGRIRELVKVRNPWVAELFVGDLNH